MKKLMVWNGTTIHHESLSEIKQAILDLAPDRQPVWLPKAGEGGSWQSTWDSHPLALDGFGRLTDMVREGNAMGLGIVPYVVVRGRPEWNDAEHKQIAEIAVATRHVVLNLECGDWYWNGPTNPDVLRAEYLEPLRNRIKDAFGGDPAWRYVKLEVTAIPRQWVVNELGGQEALVAWAKYAKAMSWECYDAIADDLGVADSLYRVSQWLPGKSASFRIPLVQKSRIPVWAPYFPTLEVWHLDGD